MRRGRPTFCASIASKRVVQANAQIGTCKAAVLDQLTSDVDGHVDGNRKTDALVTTGVAGNRGVQSNHFATHVDQRSAAVAGIDGSVGLQKILDATSSIPNVRSRLPLALMMPCVTEWLRPKGLPMAKTRSPISTLIAVAKPRWQARLSISASKRTSVDSSDHFLSERFGGRWQIRHGCGRWWHRESHDGWSARSLAIDVDHHARSGLFNKGVRWQESAVFGLVVAVLVVRWHLPGGGSCRQ